MSLGFRGWNRVHRLLWRTYRALWPLWGARYAQSQVTSSWDEESLAEAGFPCQLAFYSCPMINPPAQRDVFENKLHNIGLAMSSMQGLVLAPRQVFSFWRRVGEPIAENGFRDASVLVENRLTAAVGGGVCQLSSLLYNVALLSGCKILERHAHSVDAYGEGRYIPLGRDATVSYPNTDLCFQNPHPYPLVLVLRVMPERAEGAMYTPCPPDFSVTIAVSAPQIIPSPVRFLSDASLLPGQTAKDVGLDGKLVTAWRVVRLADGRMKRERLSRDKYAPTPTLRRYGTTQR